MERFMTQIADFSTKQDAFNADLKDDLAILQTKIDALNVTITQLQNSQGTVTPADQALIDKLVVDGKALESTADNMAGKTPPVVPAA